MLVNAYFFFGNCFKKARVKNQKKEIFGKCAFEKNVFIFFKEVNVLSRSNLHARQPFPLFGKFVCDLKQMKA